MQLQQTEQKMEAQHGVISSFPRDFLGYFGWPTLCRMEDGTLVVGASGLRNAHVCPLGRNIICTSRDDGRTWTSPQVANDSPLDDRDTGAVPLGGDKLLLSWFTTDNRKNEDRASGAQLGRWREAFARITEENASRWVGAWICTSDDRGESWQAPVRVPLTAPHGPIRRRSGDLLYFGKQFLTAMQGFNAGQGAIAAMRSTDEGHTWEELGTVPLCENTVEGSYHEPHVAELPDGRLVGLIRLEDAPVGPTLEEVGMVHFSMVQTTSEDGGRTWTPGEALGFHGCPPHLVHHSSGNLICTYGRRLEPFGERAMISGDGGASWEYDYILRDDGPDRDLGYPSTVELDDGSLLTAYYQKPETSEDKCSLLWTRWNLPR